MDAFTSMSRDEYYKKKLEERRDVDRELLERLNEISEAKSRITASEFKKFEPLYMKREKIPSRFSEEASQLAALSNELITTINPFKPFHVVDDADPSKILYTLPALYCPVEAITTDQRVTNMVEYGNLSTSDLPFHRDKANMHAVLALLKSQNLDGIKEKAKEFAELSRQFEAKKSGKTTPENTKSDSNAPTSEIEIELDFDADNEDE